MGIEITLIVANIIINNCDSHAFYTRTKITVTVNGQLATFFAPSSLSI